MDAFWRISNLQENNHTLIATLKLKLRGNAGDKATDHKSLKFKYQIVFW